MANDENISLSEDDLIEGALSDLELGDEPPPYPGDGDFPPDTKGTSAESVGAIDGKGNKIEDDTDNLISEAANEKLPDHFLNTPQEAEQLRLHMMEDRALKKVLEKSALKMLSDAVWSDSKSAKSAIKTFCHNAGSYTRHDMRLESEAIMRYCKGYEEKPLRVVGISLFAVIATILGMLIGYNLGTPLWVVWAVILIWGAGAISTMTWCLLKWNKQKRALNNLSKYTELKLMCLKELVSEENEQHKSEEREKREKRQAEFKEKTPYLEENSLL